MAAKNLLKDRNIGSKKKKNVRSRAKTGLDAVPLNSSFRICNQYFNEEIEKEDILQITKEYIEETFSAEDAKAILGNPEWNFSLYSGRAAAIYWMKQGLEFESEYAHYPEHLKELYSRFIEPGRKILKSRAPHSGEPEARPLTPTELMRRKVEATVLTDLDELVDHWVLNDREDFDVYLAFKKHGLKPAAAPMVRPWVESALEEHKGAYDKEDPDLAEGYAGVPKKELIRRIKVLEKILSDLDKIKASGAAQRKTRKPKVQSADKQVRKLQYLKESSEYKVNSVNPTTVPGAHRVFTFNTRNRIIAEYVSDKPSGLEISGTSIKGFDPEQSRRVKLRKPDDFLGIVLSKTPRQIGIEWNKLTTKTTEVNGRVDKDTIILRVLDK